MQTKYTRACHTYAGKNFTTSSHCLSKPITNLHVQSNLTAQSLACTHHSYRYPGAFRNPYFYNNSNPSSCIYV